MILTPNCAMVPPQSNVARSSQRSDRRGSDRTRWLIGQLFLVVLVGVVAGQAQESEPPATFEVLTLRGRIVWLAEAMARRHGVKSVPEVSKYVLALETKAGELYPLAEDIRGRGFRRDERLRKMDLELMVRRYHGAPVVQVIRAFEWSDKEKLELDYWCDICAIAMFELKPCDCCQGDIELRRRAVDAEGHVED